MVMNSKEKREIELSFKSGRMRIWTMIDLSPPAIGVIGIGHRVDSHGSWLCMWCVLWVMHRVVCVEADVGCMRG